MQVIRSRFGTVSVSLAALVFLVSAVIAGCSGKQPTPEVKLAASPSAIAISPTVPSELNPPFTKTSGGAPKATVDQAADFAWQEFIALNWPAGPQAGKPGQRDTASSTCLFGDPKCAGPTVWETYRSKVEIFPGQGKPPGYTDSKTASYGYDALPQYNYLVKVSACDPKQANDPVPWVNLDETDQITLDSMYAGVVQSSSSPGNSSPKLIRFLAKADRNEYVYVAQNSSPTDPTNQWWNAIPASIVSATKTYLAKNQASPPANSSQYVSLPNGTLEIKAGWRPLNPSEIKSGRFHMQTVRFYETPKTGGGFCYRDATWGLVALHIIQKTPSAPYFIYATFEQTDNLLTSDGKPVEDADGNVVRAAGTATTPQVCLQDPRPTPSPTPSMGEVPSNQGQVVVTADPKTCMPVKTPVYCSSPAARLYYRNETSQVPKDGDICVNQRDNDIPDFVIAANKQAHAAIAAYLSKNKISAPWPYYKLVNIQYYPYDKVITKVTPNGSLYTSNPPYTAQNPAPSTFYQANIVVETNRSLQLFSGGLSPNIATDWNEDGTPHKNTYYGGSFHNMGGCMGCHGSQGQNPAGQAGDFSVILARGSVTIPEKPALQTAKGLTVVRRNRSLTR